MPTKTIEVKHQITVDDCIADEVEELNNKYGILTLACCCGHGEEDGFIVVQDNAFGDDDTYEASNIAKMFELGYKMEHGFYHYESLTFLNHKFGQTKKKIVYFKCKSKCKCPVAEKRTTRKNRYDTHKR